MKQILIKKGHVLIDEVPAPIVADDSVLVQTIYSCISAGTEITGINESGKSLIKKAMEKPELLEKAFNIMKTQGSKAIFGKLKEMETSNPTGYSAAGVVIGVGKNIKDLKIGENVACAGSGVANHAEFIEVPRNLVMKIPNGLSFEYASTVALGGIAIQGVRRADSRLGEFAVVIGLGIIGQLTVQLLKISGCRVIGIDIDDRRLFTARYAGCDYVINSKNANVKKMVEDITGGYGVDSVLITASSNSNEILSEAFNICRKKGKVVLVGVVGNEYKRDDMYAKELDFVISTSYGPGRYDPLYEEKGIDYPYAYSRWTENRNMEEYLKLLNEEKINLKLLIEKIYEIDNAVAAYEDLKNPENKPLIILLKYNDLIRSKPDNTVVLPSETSRKEGIINVAVIGAGGFAKGIHLPNLQKLNDRYKIHAIMSRTGSNAKEVASKFGARYATTDYKQVLDDPDIDMVIICTRHNLHAQMSIEAMKKGKAVFVEKPMALNEKEMYEVLKTIEETKVPYTVGFNRRFSKYATEVKESIKYRLNPMIINYQMNAGYIPLNSWVHNEEGGGRIIGEGCHIFDLFNYLTDAKVISVSVESINPKTKNISNRDNLVTTIKYEDGSICTLTYSSIGSNNFEKEFCQIYCDGKIVTIDDYKKLNGYGVKINNITSKNPSKGQYEELIEFSKVIRNGINYSIPLWQLEQASRIAFEIEREIYNNF